MAFRRVATTLACVACPSCACQPDVVVGNASMYTLLLSTPVELFVNTALLESGGVAVKGTVITGITTEPVDLDHGPLPTGPPTSWTAGVFVDAR
jgi:hypothetical protein